MKIVIVVVMYRQGHLSIRWSLGSVAWYWTIPRCSDSCSVCLLLLRWIDQSMAILPTIACSRCSAAWHQHPIIKCQPVRLLGGGG